MDKESKTFENALLARMKNDDENAFSFLFSFYYTDLVMFANIYLKDKDISEELVQDVFVKLWEERQSITITSSLKSYLLKSVQNKSLDWIRHLKIRQQHNQETISSAALFDFDTENYVLYSELENRIEKIIEQLPVEIAEAYNLNRIEGLKYHEIAEKLNVSQRTVEVRIGKALQILRIELKDYLIAAILMNLSHLGNS